MSSSIRKTTKEKKIIRLFVRYGAHPQRHWGIHWGTSGGTGQVQGDTGFMNKEELLLPFMSGIVFTLGRIFCFYPSYEDSRGN